MRIRQGTARADVEAHLPLLTVVEEGNVEVQRRSSPTFFPSQSSRMRVRPSPVGAVDVEGLSLRLLPRVPPLPLLSTVEEGSVEVPKRKRRKRRSRQLNARAIADGMIL